MSIRINKTGKNAKINNKIGNNNDLDNVDITIGETGDNLTINQSIGDGNKSKGITSVWLKLFWLISVLATSYFGYLKFLVETQ